MSDVDDPRRTAFDYQIRLNERFDRQIRTMARGNPGGRFTSAAPPPPAPPPAEVYRPARTETAIGARVYLAADQAVASGVDVNIEWEVEDFDTHGFWDPATPDRMVVPEGLGGLYIVVLAANWAYNPDGRRAAVIGQNGVKGAASSMMPVTDLDTQTNQWVTDLLRLADGDYVTGIVRQQSGASVSLKAGSRTTNLAIVRLAAV